jgi:hypothetical protein
MGNSAHTSIHILDDDSLLRVFYLYRPFLLGEDEDSTARIIGGNKRWVRGRWWYKLAHVCQRWRNLILGSASYLDICLICTYGTPVADMLEHSPHLPLAIDYSKKYHDITAEDEEGAILALKQRGRVRHVRLGMPVTNLQKLAMALGEEYPILEYLLIVHPIEGDSATLIFPETFQAPHLRRLVLSGFALPIRSRLLTTAVGLVTLYLYMDKPSTYFHPNTLLQWISLMPQLETLGIGFELAVPSRDVERQLMHTPIRTAVILPNLHWFWFRGVSTYLEALIRRITAPRLDTLEIAFYNQLMFYVPHLLQFMNTTGNLRFDRAEFEFYTERVFVSVYPRGAEMHALSINVFCWHLDWQVSSVAQIFNSLSQMLPSVEHLILGRKEHSRSSEEHNEVDRTEWRKIFRSFGNVKTLRIDKGLVGELSRCLKLEDGELPLGLLPELQELTYTGSGEAGDPFTSFTDARQSAGRPVILDRRSPSPDPSPSVPLVKTSSISPRGWERLRYLSPT